MEEKKAGDFYESLMRGNSIKKVLRCIKLLHLKYQLNIYYTTIV